MAKDVIAAAEGGGVSIFVNGVDPSFANDGLPLTLTGISERIEQVRCVELLNYTTHDQASVLKDILGFGTSLDETPYNCSAPLDLPLITGSGQVRTSKV